MQNIIRFMNSKQLLLLLLFLKISSSFSQSANTQINQISDDFLERIEVKTANIANSYHKNIKPYSREQIGEYLSNIDTLKNLKFSKIDKKNLEYLQIDNWEFIDTNKIVNNKSQKSILKYLYQNKSDMYFVKNEEFDIHVSPILHVSIGKYAAYGTLPSKNAFINTRGIEIRGQINKKLGFYTMVTDNQNSSPYFLVKYYNSYQGYPYQSFVKYKAGDHSLLQADYFQAIGYLTFKPIKNLIIALGHDKNFIGYGIRSMVLSDFSAPYMQLKADLRLGRMQYLSILAQMTDLQIINPPFSQITNAPKYFAFHHLNFNITKTLNIGLYESVMYGRRKTGFELNYLNPVIFYRFIEGYLGSSDNAMVGADFKLNFLKTASIYGQYYLDEYNSKEFKNKGWWSKKYAWQLGLKYFDVFKINNLDFQMEFNRARPYMYSHFTTSTNIVNYNLPLAHPLGANFKENLLSIKYQPHPKVFLNYTSMNATKGEDYGSTNFGGNIKLNNKFDRPSDYYNFISQGFKNRIKNSEVSAAIMVKHNFFVEFIFQHRRDSYLSNSTEKIYTTGIRWNIARKQMLF